MSDRHYPLQLTQALRITNIDRVVADDMENGITFTRRLWAARAFRRSLQIQHTAITPREFIDLQDFYRDHGRYDAFWYRDNTQRRTGNYRVRFSTPPPDQLERLVLFPSVELEEIAPIVVNPDIAAIVTAVSATPLFWYDANREYYFNGARANAGNMYAEDRIGAYNLNYVTANNSLVVNTQWQDYNPTSAGYGRSTVNLTGLAAGQPATTLFCFCKAATASTRSILFSTGPATNGASLGIELSSTNVFVPFLYGTQSWTGPVFSNSPAQTWRSIALVWPASSNSATLYVNGVSIGTDSSNARSYVQDLITMGADRAGAKTVDAGANLAHAMAFAAALNVTQIKALHNLFGYQYGLATVA